MFFIHIQYLRTMEIQISLINSYLAFCFLLCFCDNVIAIRCICNFKVTSMAIYYTSDPLWKMWLVESIAFIMSSSTSAWLLSPLECSSQKQNGWTLRFYYWGWYMWMYNKMYNKTIIEFGFLHDIINYQNLVSLLSASAFGFGR